MDLFELRSDKLERLGNTFVECLLKLFVNGRSDLFELFLIIFLHLTHVSVEGHANRFETFVLIFAKVLHSRVETCGKRGDLFAVKSER